jgi:hypothetical protein
MTDQFERDLENRLFSLEPVIPEAPPIEVAARRARRRRAGRVIFTSAAALAIVTLGALLVDRSNSSPDAVTLGSDTGSALTPTEEIDQIFADWGTGPCPEPNPRPDPYTDEARALHAERVARTQEIVEELGWQPWRVEEIIDGGWVCGWTPVDDRNVTELRESMDAAPQGTPLYDRPNGHVVGYMFGAVGFVSNENLDSPEFDLEAEMIAKNGCPELYPSACEEDDTE